MRAVPGRALTDRNEVHHWVLVRPNMGNLSYYSAQNVLHLILSETPKARICRTLKLSSFSVDLFLQ
jgi:hypothetical protein